MRLFALGLLVAFLPGCSQFDLLNVLVPTGTYRVARDIPYAGLDRQKLDVYRPKDLKAPAPVVVFFYGGSWQNGEKRDYRFVAEALASRGFVAVLPDYRLYPAVTFPAFVEDGALAVKWARDHAARYGGDPDRIFLMGHSAGAHTAALLAFDERYLTAAGVEPGMVRGFAGLAGPYQMTPLKEDVYKSIFATAEQPQWIDPVAFVDGSEPPALLLHGGEDATVRPFKSHLLAQAIRENGGRVTLIEYPDLGHVGIVLALAKPFRCLAPVLDDVAEFFHETAAAPDPRR